MQHDSHIIRPPTEQKTLEWVAALSASGIPHQLHHDSEGWVLKLAEQHLEAAQLEIAEFEQVNQNWPPSVRPKSLPVGVNDKSWSGLTGSVIILAFFVLLGAFDSERAIHLAAASHSVALVNGEWWRPITALCMHSGFSHVAGNAAFLALFALSICRLIGSGVGWFLILASGIIGNVIVAKLSTHLHVSVGASTSVFGALGILSMMQAVLAYQSELQWHSIFSRLWLPLMAGAGFLGLMGVSENADLAAHFYGFVIGLLLGLSATPLIQHPLPFWPQRLLQITCLATLLWAWRAALIFQS